jgi:hypothetical protein
MTSASTVTEGASCSWRGKAGGLVMIGVGVTVAITGRKN